MLTKTKKGNRHTIEFTNIEDLYQYVKDTPDHHNSQTGTERFTGTKDFNEALSLFRNGWPEGVGKIDEALNLIESAYEGTAQAYNFDVSGLMVDVGTYLTGQPECWLSPVEEHAEKTAVTVQISVDGNGHINAQSFINRGGAIMAIIDHLNKSHIIDLELFIYGKDAWRGESLQLVYKTNTERTYSKDTLAFMIANPSYLRRIYFAVCERVFNVSNCQGYGYATDLPRDEQKGYYFPPLTNDYQWSTPEAAAEQVKQFLNERKES